MKQESINSRQDPNEMIDGRIFEGKYIFFPERVSLSDVSCTRCDHGEDKNMRWCYVKPGEDNRKVCFCMNINCLRQDADASKKIARREYTKRFKEEVRKQQKAAKNEK